MRINFKLTSGWNEPANRLENPQSNLVGGASGCLFRRQRLSSAISFRHCDPAHAKRIAEPPKKKEGSSLIWAFHKILHVWLHFFFWGNPSWPVNKGFLRQLRHIGKPVQRFQISRERHSQSGRHLRSMIRLAIHVYHLGLSVHRSSGFHDNAGANILTVRIGCFTSDPISRPHTKNGNKYRAIPGTAVRLLFIPKKYKSQKVRWFF